MFLLTRPFLKGDLWGNDASEKARWGLNAEAYHYTPTVEHADAIFIPHSINWYAEKRQWGKLEAYNDLCKTHKIKAYAFISGDWGKAFPEFD
ncbi:MAG: hypothetical protein KDC56_08605, partial [Flavobacteriaceae bacterium]|nr:hypothetical protein [Flavobacteriaceae bacterium]